MLKNIFKTMKMNIPPDLNDEFRKEITFLNIQNGIIFSIIVIAYNLISIIFDIFKFKNGLWESVPVYKYIAFLHILIITAVFIFLAAVKISAPKKSSEIKKIHEIMVIFFALFYLTWCSISSRLWLEAGFPMQVYTLGILFTTAGLIMTNREALFLYFSTFIFYEIVININIINNNMFSSDNNIIVFVLFAISRSLYYYRMKEFLNEKALNRKLYTALETIEDSMIITDLNGKIIDANHSANLLHESSSNDKLQGRQISDFIPFKEIINFTKNLSAAIETGVVREIQFPVKTLKGNVFPAEINISSIYDEEKKPSSLLFLIRNQTEEKKLHLEIKKNENYLRTLVNKIPEYIFVYQGNKIVYINESITGRLGYKEQEVLGKNIFQFIENEHDKEKVKKNLQRRINGEEVEDYEITIRDSSGNPRILIIRAQLFEFDENPAILVLGVDITERIKMQNELNQILLQNSAILATVPAGIAFTVDRSFKWVN